SSKITLNLTPPPFVNAGNDSTICAGNIVELNGVISGTASQGIWSTSNGTGTFNNASNLNTNYIPSTADSAAGSVTLILTTTDHGKCNPAVDSIVVSISPRPFASTVADTSVCLDVNQMQLSATFAYATSVEW